MQKQVLAIHDMSCVGRCSLTVALPILSCAGAQVSVLPTALLSTHTGEFTGYTCLDLTAEMEKILRHFDALSLRFDALYPGFLGSYAQLALVEEVLRRYRRPGTLTLVDPVMADHGQLYATYTREMAAGMGRLCRQADVIVPNLTEAALLLGEPYRAQVTLDEAEGMLRRLSSRYDCPQVIITGITSGDELGAVSYDRARGDVAFAGHTPFDGIFYGTGDVLASAVLGALLCGQPLRLAVRNAVDFTCLSMSRALENGLPRRYGVAFEQALPLYMERLGLMK